MNRAVYVKIDDYQEILNIIEVIKGNLDKTKDTISAINELKQREDEILHSWTSNLDEITGRIEDISKTLFEPKE
ncbi:MAG: hypothetical protein V1743_03610 [Nanoarchaeota archaeon]